MVWGEGASMEMERKGVAKYPARPSDPKSKAFETCPSEYRSRLSKLIDLDMGEASREQGFRLNGCR